MTIFLTALLTLVVTVLAGVALDYIRHGRPKVTYSVKDAVPIDLGDGRCLGAYLVSLSNPSKRVVKDVTCHIKAPGSKLRNGGVTTSQGLQYSATDSDDRSVEISIPYLKRGDEFQITAIAEGLFVPKTPDVAIRSPQDVDVVATSQGMSPRRTFLSSFWLPAIVGAIVASTTVALRSDAILDMRNPKDVLTFAASMAGLPRLADLYATSADVNYYDQGDLAYAWAAASSDPAEIGKYRELIYVTLATAPPGMMSQSRANLYYSLGKIDLLLADKNSAVQDFRQAIDHSKSTVKAKTKVDSEVREFLIANGLH